jgi:hypothetical protein
VEETRKLIRPKKAHMERIFAIQEAARERGLPVPTVLEIYHYSLRIGIDAMENGETPLPTPAPPPAPPAPRPVDTSRPGRPRDVWPADIVVFALGKDGRPTITLCQDEKQVAKAAEDALLLLRNGADPAVYRTSEVYPKFVSIGEAGAPEYWTPNKLLSVLIDCARWQKPMVRVNAEGKEVVVYKQIPTPPARVVRLVYRGPKSPFPTAPSPEQVKA